MFALALGAAILVTNAAETSWTVWHDTARPQRQFVKAFCDQWAWFPDDYERAMGHKALRLPDVTVNIYNLAPDMPLSSYSSFLWSDARAIRAMGATQRGLRPGTRGLLDVSPRLGRRASFS